MFGGLVETVGRVQSVCDENGCKLFSIAPRATWNDLKVGDSIAVNGVCLTATRVSEEGFECSAVPETLARTNLGQVRVGSCVNLERALKVDSRIGGHYVQGHIDGVGEIIHLTGDGKALLVTIKIPPVLAKYIIDKGYIAIDGMSITIIRAEEQQFTVTFIPHTQETTIIDTYCLGRQLNLEVDILGKYIEKLLRVAS